MQYKRNQKVVLLSHVNNISYKLVKIYKGDILMSNTRFSHNLWVFSIMYEYLAIVYEYLAIVYEYLALWIFTGKNHEILTMFTYCSGAKSVLILAS